MRRGGGGGIGGRIRLEKGLDHRVKFTWLKLISLSFSFFLSFSLSFFLSFSFYFFLSFFLSLSISFFLSLSLSLYIYACALMLTWKKDGGRSGSGGPEGCAALIEPMYVMTLSSSTFGFTKSSGVRMGDTPSRCSAVSNACVILAMGWSDSFSMS